MNQEPRENPILELLSQVRVIIPEEYPVYLVGGAIRDMLVGKQSHDLDFVLPDRAISCARSVADTMNGDFYILDKSRNIARVIIDWGSVKRVLDFHFQIHILEMVKKQE